MSEERNAGIEIRIGELLVRAGVVTNSDLLEAEKLSKQMKMQFGRILIMSGCLTEHELTCALEAQRLIREELLTVDLACEALCHAAHNEPMTLEAALRELNIVPQFGTATFALAEVILEANILQPEKLEMALETSVSTNAPLPDVLVEFGELAPSLALVLRDILTEIKSGTLNGPVAVGKIRAAYAAWQKAEESARAKSFGFNHARSGSGSSRRAGPDVL